MILHRSAEAFAEDWQRRSSFRVASRIEWPARACLLNPEHPMASEESDPMSASP